MSDSTPTLERVALALCRAHDGHLAGKSGCAETAFKAGSPAVAYWLSQARAALDASGNDELVEALTNAAIDLENCARRCGQLGDPGGQRLAATDARQARAAIARTQEQSDLRTYRDFPDDLVEDRHD